MATQVDGRYVLTNADVGYIDRQYLRIRFIKWVSAGASSNDQVILQDQSGVPVWQSVAPGPQWESSDGPYTENQNTKLDNRLVANGLTVNKLDSGTVIIYFDRNASANNSINSVNA